MVSTVLCLHDRYAIQGSGLGADLFAAHSVLADKLSYLAEVNLPSDTPEAMDEARLAIRRALELSPGDANVMFNVAIGYWHLGQMTESETAMKRVLELDPNHGLTDLCVPRSGARINLC